MKKVMSLITIIAVCLSLILATASCSAKHPIEAFKEKIENANSYQMTVTMSNVPLFGTFSITTKVDGNIQYTPAVMFNEEQYIELVGDTEYIYTKNASGNWQKKAQPAESNNDSLYDNESLLELFNPDNYEKESGKNNTYKQKKDVSFDTYENVVFIIEDDTCTIEMSANSEGIVLGLKIVFSEINKIDLTLPEIN